MPEGAYCSPHAPSDLYHILQVIYIYVQIFGGLCAFFAIFVAFILITSLQERGLVAPTGYHATAIYTLAMYMGDGDDEC